MDFIKFILLISLWQFVYLMKYEMLCTDLLWENILSQDKLHKSGSN